MSESPTKLDALGELLGVEDDTREVERPARRGPAVGEVLRGATTPRPTAPPPAGERLSSRDDNGDDAATAGPAARQKQPSSRVQPAKETPAGARPARQRTSANLPVELVD